MSPARLIVGIEDMVTSARPEGWRSLADVQIGRHVFETMVREHGDHTIGPGVAETWTVDGGGTEWRFKIARGRQFHDGSPLNAGAVASCLADGILETAALAPYVVGLETCGNDTVILRTAGRVGSLLHRLAMPKASFVSPQSRRSGEAIGSGPYRRAPTGGPRVNLTRVDDDAAVPAYAEIEFVPLHDGPAMWECVRLGAVDVIYECPYDRVPRRSMYGIVDGITVRTCPSLSVNMLVFQTTRGPGGSARLRRCVQTAIDTERMLHEVHLGVGVAPRGPISPASFFFEPGVGPPVSRASTVRGARIRVLATRGYYAGALDFLRRQLAAISIHCDFELLPFPEFAMRLQGGDFDAALTGASGGSDPDIFLTEFFHSRGRSNFGQLRDADLDTYIDRARETLDVSHRRGLYQRAVQRILELAPAVFLRHGASIVAHRQDVGGLLPRGDHLLQLDKAFDASSVNENVPKGRNVVQPERSSSCKQSRVERLTRTGST